LLVEAVVVQQMVLLALEVVEVALGVFKQALYQLVLTRH
jgi:hypothetical protein